MIAVKELQQWLNGIDDGEYVFIDEGGLTLVHTDDHYIEIGGEELPNPRQKAKARPVPADCCDNFRPDSDGSCECGYSFRTHLRKAK